MRPVPRPCSATVPFWDSTRRHELCFPRCPGCGTITFPPESFCPACGSFAFEWVQSSGRGRVYSYTIVQRQPAEGFDVPLVLVLVELEEGWHLMSHLVECELSEVSSGLEVSVHFDRVTDEITLPLFVPAARRE